ncbi:MAG: phosphoribosylglycinamide formyltransferase [Bacteroidia bacterium]
MNTPVRIAIFASGDGSNARRLLEHFQHSDAGSIRLLASNNPASGIFDLGQAHGVPAELLRSHRDGDYLAAVLAAYDIELLVLAGYLKLIPASLVARYPRRIVNIHPALLPAYGGKGMYGMNVHRAVITNGERRSGITIHFIDEDYDRGEICFQQSLAVDPHWSAQDLQQAVLHLEHQYFPEVVEKVCRELRSSCD